MVPYNKPIILENIFYDFDTALLRADSKEELDGLITLLNSYPNISIELSAHTDCRGDEDYNIELSLRRAQSVVDYLIERGIDKRRLITVGYGKSMPMVVNSRIAERYDFLNPGDLLSEQFIQNLTVDQQRVADQLNRRTEFKVVDHLY